MKKLFFTISFAVFCIISGFAQNIAIISIRLNTDAFQFVALEDLTAGATISFTDNGVAASGASFEADGEGGATYTVPAGGITCGTVVTGPLGTMALANGGDQVTAYTGTFGSPNIIAHISTTTWITTGTTTAGTSYAPGAGNIVNPTTSNISSYNGPTFVGGCGDINITALTTASNYGTSTYPYANASILPVSLLSFECKLDATSTLLSFATVTERNNSHFEIERSTNGTTFEKIGEVAGKGNSVELTNYTFEDKNPLSGVNYYRLRQVDFDGAFEYSAVRSVVFGSTKKVTVFPAPVAAVMTVQLDEAFNNDAQWQITDMAGRLVAEGVFAAEQNQLAIPVNALTEGVYVLRIVAAQETITRQFRKI